MTLKDFLLNPPKVFEKNFEGHKKTARIPIIKMVRARGTKVVVFDDCSGNPVVTTHGYSGF